MDERKKEIQKARNKEQKTDRLIQRKRVCAKERVRESVERKKECVCER